MKKLPKTTNDLSRKIMGTLISEEDYKEIEKKVYMITLKKSHIQFITRCLIYTGLPFVGVSVSVNCADFNNAICVERFQDMKCA